MSTAGTPVEGARGNVSARGVRVGIIVARFNADVTERLLAGARRCLLEHGGSEERIDIYRVPGAWELPQAAAQVLAHTRHEALLALGCVIRGETPHFDYVAGEASRGLGDVARASRTPVLFGVLTTDDRDQALARAGDGPTNKGYEAALSALQMVDLYRSLEGA